MASKFFKAGAKVFEYLKPKPKVNKTKLDKAKSELAIAKQKTKASKAKLNQTLFEIKNKKPLTFSSQRGIKTKSNTELKKEKKVEKEKKFKKTMDDNKKIITRIFNAPKNFNKGGRVGLKKGGGSDLGMQSVKHGIDNNPKITAADPKAKFIAAAKNKKSKKKVI
jgi:archaellum component FlaD/FlaE